MKTLGQAWIEQALNNNENRVMLQDSLGAALSFEQALLNSILLAGVMHRKTRSRNVGVILPTSVAGMICNMAAIVAGKTVVNLNYTNHPDSVAFAVEFSEVDTVFTSRKFMEKLRTNGSDLLDLEKKCQLIFLEDIRTPALFLRKLYISLSLKIFSAPFISKLFLTRQNPEDPAVILFSSGSEGLPKAVILSHKNIMTNINQIAEVLHIIKDDAILANLPFFHSFGLTVTLFMPLTLGMRVICHTDPRDVMVTSQLIEKHQATLLFGSSTFYRLYTRNSKIMSSQLASLRLVISGAEKLQDSVRKDFIRKFGKEILEGYGATETSPVASVNMPDSVENGHTVTNNKPGSVGKPLPGTRFRIIDPHSGEVLAAQQSGMILISGGQVMQGYLNNPDQTSKALLKQDGITWYITGDKGYLDKDGFLFVEDRYARFAKIGGEMVSLAVVENAIHECLNDHDKEFVAVAVPDTHKGEQIVVLVNGHVDKAALISSLDHTSLNKLAYPAAFCEVPEIPKLSSGKLDLVRCKQIASNSS